LRQDAIAAVLVQAHLAAIAAHTRAPAEPRGFHPGQGLWDDFGALVLGSDDEDDELDHMERGFSEDVDGRRLGALEVAFQRTSRLSSSAFVYVSNAIREEIGRQPAARGPDPFDCEFNLAITLYYLATGCSFQEVTQVMRRGISEAHVRRTVKMVTRAIFRSLSSKLIKFPTTEAGRQVISSVFELRSGIPGVLGAIDCTHIRVSPKANEQGSYINRKGYYSLVVSAVCDYRGYFMSVHTGYPGKMSDSKALQLSDLWESAWAMFGQFGYFLYGDAGYPLKLWLLTGFRNAAKCTNEQLKFNTHGSRARVIIECAFGKVKGQWRILQTGLRQNDWDDWNFVILACFILHNVTILVMGQGWKRNDAFNANGPRRLEAGGAFPMDPNEVPPNPMQRGRDDRRAKAWRERIFDRLRQRW